MGDMESSYGRCFEEIGFCKLMLYLEPGFRR